MDYIGFSDDKFFLLKDIEIAEKISIAMDENGFVIEEKTPEMEFAE